MTMFYNRTHKCLPHHASFSVPCSTQGRSINVPLSGRRLATAKLLMYRRRCCTLIVIFFFTPTNWGKLPPNLRIFCLLSILASNNSWHVSIQTFHPFQASKYLQKCTKEGFFCTHYLLTFINVSAFVVLSQELNCTHSKMM